MGAIEDLTTAVNAQNAAIAQASGLLQQFDDLTQKVDRDPARMRSGLQSVVDQAQQLIALSQRIYEKAQALKARLGG